MSFWREQVIQPALNGDLEAAMAEQYRILQTDPKNPPAHFALGTLRHFQGQIELAIECFLQAIQLDPAYAAPHVSLGRIYAVKGRYEEAWRHAREAAQLGDSALVEQLERYPSVE